MVYLLLQLACSIHINQIFQHAIGIIDPMGVEWDDKICQNICFFFLGGGFDLIEILVRGFNLFEKICSSNWIISPCFGVNTQNI